MADKKLSSVSAVSDMNYVYAETSSGETVKISKTDLASVVAGLVNLLRSKGFSNSTDLNDNIFSSTGFWTVTGNASHSPVSSGLLLLVTLNGREDSTSTLTIVQLAITLSTGIPSLYIRTSWGGWNDWKLIG